MLFSSVAREILTPFVVIPGGHRHRALKDLRQWERCKDRLRRTRNRAVLGAVLAVRSEQLALRPYDLGKLGPALRRASGPRVAELLGWLVAAEKCFKRPGVRLRHRDLARLLNCSERTAGDAMRAAVEAGHVTRVPWFRSRSSSPKPVRGKKLDQMECLYLLSDEFNALRKLSQSRGFTASLLAGKNCQATRIQNTTYSVKRSRVRDNVPESGTSAAADQPAPRAQASSQAAAGELRTGGGLPSADRSNQYQPVRRPAADLDAFIAAGWAAFERKQQREGRN